MSLPISEIPKETRPVLGCVLWRLHEKGATLWDKNRTLLLCDDEKTNALAKKLGIVTKTMVDLRKLGDAEGMTDERRETFGDLEKHFNLPEMVKATPSLEIEKEAKMTSALPTPDEGNEAKVDVSGALKQVKCTAPSSSSRDSTESTHSAVSSKFERKSAELEEPHDQKASRSTTKGDRHKKSDVGGLSNAPSDEHEKRTGSRSSLRSAAVAAPIAEPAESDQAAVQPSQPISNTLDAEKKHSIAAWVKGLIDAANNSEHSGRDSPISGHSSAVEATAQQTEPAKPFKPLTYRQAVTGKADEVVKKNAPLSPKEIIHSPRASPAREPSPPKAEESIGSDEEEIVFNPKSKRLSAQKAQQVQQNKQAPQVAQSQQPQQPQTPQPSPRHGHARNVSGGRALIRGGFQRQSRPGPPPVVIDPDSFGRGLATNPQPVVARTFSPYGAHGRVANDRRGNHRSPNHRSSAQNIPPKVNGAALPNGSANAITLPPAEQIPATNGSAAAEPAPAVEAPVTTIVPSVLQPSPVVNGSPVGPSLPRSSPALNGLQNTPAFPIRVERPRYSPRGSPRRAPIVPEPEVGYVLKSGQTREATRGRGKLWVP
ncbi:MAG: hypothetical protein LQ338_001752 [Usnochroma carphineum]|nr:MAG: hypothetical protein LQ338_001752 [Usnochroma carphineum]